MNIIYEDDEADLEGVETLYYEGETKAIKIPWYELFNHGYKVILFMYLMHRPDCSKGIEKAFKNPKIDKLVNEKSASLKQDPNIKKFLTEMKRDNLIYEFVPDKKEFNRSKYYSINPNVFSAIYYHGDISDPNDTDMIDDELEILSMIIKRSSGRYELVKGILNYSKFDYVTILLHYKKMVELLNPAIIESTDMFLKPIKENIKSNNKIDDINMFPTPDTYRELNPVGALLDSEIEGIEALLNIELILERFGREYI